MDRPLTATEQIEAKRRIEVDFALMRDVRHAAMRLRTRANLLRGEIAGARQAIAEKEHVIREAEGALAELDERLAKLAQHESQIQDDQASWSDRLAG